MRFRLRLNIYAHLPRPTLDGPGPFVRLHNPYAGGCRAGPPLTGRRTTCVSITLTSAAPRTLWATSPPAPPLTLPKSASGLSGAPHATGTPAPSPPRTLLFLYYPWRSSLCNLLAGLARRPAFCQLLTHCCSCPTRVAERHPAFFMAALAAAGKIL